MKAIKRVLLIINFFLLLVVPYSFLAYLCYLGLCPGAPYELLSGKYAVFYGYYTWIYFLVVAGSLIFYFVVKNKNERRAVIALIVPLLGLLPLIFVEMNVWKIAHHRDEIWQEMNRAKPGDYVCSPGKFIRIEGGRYSFYNYNEEGGNGSTSAYANFSELESALKERGIVIQTCKNKAGNILIAPSG